MPKQTFFNLPEAKRRKIIDLAIEEFAENDYQAGSISRIVAKAGIAKGSFYQYFEDKKDLYMYLIGLAGQQKAEFLQEMPTPEPQMGTFAYLRWLFTAAVKFEFDQPRLSSVAYRAYYGDTPFVQELLEQGKAASNDFVEQMVRQGIERGDLRADIDVESAVFLFNTLFGELGNYILKRMGIPPDQLDKQGARIFEAEGADLIFDSFMDLLEKGMGAK